jgi:outer membrane protein OmpA-like peptidoglycan-associated protein
MMKKRQKIDARLLLAPLVFSLSLSASTYDDTYTVIQDKNTTLKVNENTFMQGDFKEIIRFNAIEFDGKQIKEESRDILNNAISKIKTYQDAKKAIKITVIGYTNEPTDDPNEKTIDSQTYANTIQNWFRYSEDTNSTLQRSKEYANDVYKKMIDTNITKENLYLEYRGGADLAYTDEDSDSRDLSNRVMITMYVVKPVDIDSDKDGVFDSYDTCPSTPIGAKVNKNGCPVDTDKDGVVDYKDLCADTPLGIIVDEKGCPLDNDKDGVADYEDQCLNTPLGLSVDPNGCPLEQKLALNFKQNSDKILMSSLPVVKKFANFLKNNKLYKVEIIGHTDSVGKASINMNLSKRRAKTVKAALVNQGVEASRIKTSGRGELDPILSNRTKEGRSVNRRIEVKLSY